MTFKERIHLKYRQLVQDKIDVYRDMIANLADDAQNDAKSSAGDKHETALSMMHLEQEKLVQKLRENLEMQAILDNPALIDQFAQQIEAPITVQQCTDGILEIYQQVLERAGVCTA